MIFKSFISTNNFTLECLSNKRVDYWMGFESLLQPMDYNEWAESCEFERTRI